MNRLSRFARAVLAFNLGVIAWGAYVRATGSGAGCGAHWPLCNGEIVPRAPSVEMIVEFSHRVSSGLALLSVVTLAVVVWRRLPAGHPARRYAAGACVFMLTEAAVGAALVLFRLVADNASMARAMFMSVHLLNTFVLLAFLTLTAYWLSPAHVNSSAARRGVAVASGKTRALAWLAVGAAGLVMVGISGAVAALGDTLYPSGSLAAGLAADLSTTSHLLIRLRVLHPTIAITVGVLVIAGAFRVRGASPGSVPAAAVAGFAALQMVAGVANVLLLAPVWMQMVHLLIADAVWISYVIMGARLVQDREPWIPTLSSSTSTSP
ncbi:MAG: COX15/CtaA family protein [Bacteroidales bacterium]